MLTITAVRPPARFGELSINSDSSITSFKEKPQLKHGWINGGFMVANKKILDFIKDDNEMFEREPLNRLVEIDQVNAYKHNSFWKCMDSKRDHDYLELLLKSGKAPWINK